MAFAEFTFRSYVFAIAREIVTCTQQPLLHASSLLYQSSSHRRVSPSCHSFLWSLQHTGHGLQTFLQAWQNQHQLLWSAEWYVSKKGMERRWKPKQEHSSIQKQLTVLHRWVQTVFFVIHAVNLKKCFAEELKHWILLLWHLKWKESFSFVGFFCKIILFHPTLLIFKLF